MQFDIIAFVFTNFALVMFVVAAFFMLLHYIVNGRRVSQYEIVYRWMALFALGFVGVYAFIMHVFFPYIAATSIGWVTSPFQYEVGMADLALGVLGILSFNASYGFRLATVIAALFMLWGDASGHVYQIVKNQDFFIGNAGSWLWMDILVPFLLLICITKLKPSK